MTDSTPSHDRLGHLRWTATSCRRCGYEQADCTCVGGFVSPVTDSTPILALDAALCRELSGVQVGRVYPAYEAVRDEIERLQARVAELEMQNVDLMSIILWCKRRLSSPMLAPYVDRMLTGGHKDERHVRE